MVDDMEGLAERRCEPCRGGVPRLSPERAAELAAATPGWRLEAFVLDVRAAMIPGRR